MKLKKISENTSTQPSLKISFTIYTYSLRENLFDYALNYNQPNNKQNQSGLKLNLCAWNRRFHIFAFAQLILQYFIVLNHWLFKRQTVRSNNDNRFFQTV